MASANIENSLGNNLMQTSEEAKGSLLLLTLSFQPKTIAREGPLEDRIDYTVSPVLSWQ